MRSVLQLSLIGLFVSSLAITPAAKAENLDDIFKKVNKYVEENNFPKALEELDWAKNEINKMHGTKLETFFPDQLAGFTGDKFKSSQALGISQIERTYRKSGAGNVKVSLMGGSGQGGGALGGIAAFGRMAAMMGSQPGQEKIRIDGKTAVLEEKDNYKRAELTVFLDSGSMIKFEMSNSSNGSDLKKMAEDLKINDLDNYLRGVS